MSLVSALYPALKPWLFKLDAERAHEWTTKMMRISHSLGMLKPDELPASKPVDCLGLRCPIPIIRLAKAMPGVAVGEIIRVLADDPAAANDIAAWCRMKHQELVAADGHTFDVRRVT